MNEVLFSLEIPKTFEVGVVIGSLIGFIAGAFINIYNNTHT